MDFPKRISEESLTLVIVPTMLTSFQNIEDLIDAPEARFLTNRDEHLHFGLLTDFRNALEETLQKDESLLRLFPAIIEGLRPVCCAHSIADSVPTDPASFAFPSVILLGQQITVNLCPKKSGTLSLEGDKMSHSFSVFAETYLGYD